jgi:predicted amidohydrolase
MPPRRRERRPDRRAGQEQTMMACWKTLALLLSAIACALPVRGATQATVRVAAVQCYSPMGRTADNVSNLVTLISQAARGGAQIIVTPECAVQGYMYPPTWTSWTAATNAAMSAGRVAQPVPGPSTAVFSQLARELAVYLCVGLVEQAGDKFFNAQVLIAPDGAIVAHHRKKALWTPGDSLWCTRGDLPVQVVDTPFGRLGLMICFDFHDLPEQLAARKADIVLYSVGWYGPNEKQWFEHQFPERAVIPYGFSVAAANWSGGTAADQWPGRGYSCIITADGCVAAMARTVVGNEVVMADIPLKPRKPGSIPAK